MYHLRLKGGHYEMGVKRGKIFKRGHISFTLRLDEFQLEHGKQSEAVLRTYFPEVCEEIRGVSDTIGIDYLHFASWMLCMGCCMYNLEENIPVEVRGCTAFAYSKGGRMVIVECTPSVKNIREAEKFDNGRIVCTINSFISNEMKSYDDSNGNDYDSHKRYRVVIDSFSSERIKDDYVETTKQLLRGDFGFMCQYDNEPDFETVWSSIFDLKSLSIYRAEGDPRKKKYVSDHRLHDAKFT